MFINLFILVSFFGQTALANPTSESSEDEDATTKDPRIVTETFGLEPGANVSRKTNFTLLDESLSKKMKLELWVEKKLSSSEDSRRRMLEDAHSTGDEVMIY